MSPTFITLPLDVLVDEILLQLPWPTLVALMSTCKALRHLIAENETFAYQKELYLSGMIDNPRSNVPLPSKLEQLREREARWRHFVPRSATLLHPPADNEGHYEMEGGTYLLGGKRPASHNPDRIGVVYGCSTSTDSDSPSGGASGRVVWEPLPVVDTSISIIDFGVSIEDNDLIALACYSCNNDLLEQITIHLKSWSTKDAHPSASYPILETDFRDVEGYDPVTYPGSRYFCDVRIHDDILAALIRFSPWNPGPSLTERSELCIWNWKTGKRTNSVPVSSSGGVLFLGEDILCVPNSVDFSFDVYRVAGLASESSTRVGKAMSDVNEDSSPSLTFVARLCLPELAEHVTASMQCKIEPNIRHPPRTPPPYIPPSRPFTTDPSESILLASIDLNRDEWASFALHVHRESLLELALAVVDPNTQTTDAATSTSSGLGVPRIPWEEWGPERCRFISCKAADNPFVTASYGSRWVSLGYHRIVGGNRRMDSDGDDEDSDSDDDESVIWEPRLQINDYGRRKVNYARFQAKSNDAPDPVLEDTLAQVASRVELMDLDQPTRVIDVRYFKQVINTTLPFIKTVVSPLEDEPDESAANATEVRQDVADWIERTLVTTRRTTKPLDLRNWNGVMMSEQCFFGSVRGSSTSAYRPEEFEVFHLG